MYYRCDKILKYNKYFNIPVTKSLIHKIRDNTYFDSGIQMNCPQNHIKDKKRVNLLNYIAQRMILK